MGKYYFIYILCNDNNSVMYTGRCEDITERVKQHKLKLVEGFTKRYNITKLVYYEIYETAENAATREWKLKKWKREWKDELVNKLNPEWQDLYDDLIKLVS